MALRKYRQKRTESSALANNSAALSTAAKVAAPEDPTPPENQPLPEAQPAPQPESTTAESSAHSLKTQLDHLRRGNEAERLKAQASIPLEQQIDKLPGLSLAQRAWLRQHPHALTRLDLLSHAHEAALHYGITPDTPQYFQYIESALHHFGNLAFHSPPPTQAPAEHPPAQRQPMPEPDESDYNPAIHSAPPSRNDYGPTMGGHGANSRITLSPEQRAFAASQGIEEVEYAKQLLKLQQMKRAGIIRD